MNRKTRLTPRQKTSRRINQKRRLRQWWQTTARRVFLVSLFAIVFLASAGGWWFWHSGHLEQIKAALENRIWQQTARLGFRIGNVYLEGRHFTSLASVNGALDVHEGEPILALSLPDIRARLEAIPRIKYAEVARVLPDQLHVRILEREPVAVWQDEGRLRLIDPDGMVMEYVHAEDYGHLFLVVGEDAPAHVRDLLTILALEPDRAKDVQCAIRVGERRWNLRFRNGVELKLPEEKPDEAWRTFARLDREHHLLQRAIASVDMRLGDRLFIRPARAVAKDPGSET